LLQNAFGKKRENWVTFRVPFRLVPRSKMPLAENRKFGSYFFLNGLVAHGRKVGETREGAAP
jgi:hypothetical protein